MNDVSPATRVDRDPSTAEAAGAHYDVLIVGAGLSGVGAACHLVQKRPGTSIVNGEIETFTEAGLRLASGQELAADIIVTATGLKVRLMGRIAIEVDGTPVDIASTTTYKSVMFSDIPNLASIFGYTNASWTLKSDLIADYVPGS